MTCTSKTLSWIMIPMVLGFFLGSIMVQTHLDVSTPLATVNPAGTAGAALIVYHPGFSDFNEQVAMAYAAGLESADWVIHLSSASHQAPIDLKEYELLVLAAPTYAWKPASPVLRFVDRCGDFAGLPTVLILTAAGSSEAAAAVLSDAVTAANADIVDVLEVWQAAPNEEVHGIPDAMEIARRAGAAISIP